MKRNFILWFIVSTLAFSGCSSVPCDDTHPCVRILFLGNSYTYVNDLPGTLTQLAKSGGKHVETEMVAEGGLMLADHAGNSATLDKIASTKWDYVVLQEQSQTPSVEQGRVNQMYPAARTLVSKIKAAGSTPLFFMTWGHRNGWPENGLPNYASMQSQISSGYTRIAQELAAPVAPVGNAWALAVQQHPELELWQEDGSHPSEQGTYLAACVFYAVIFKESPEGLRFRGNLSKEIAQTLQALAAETVLSKHQLPGLP
jgi:uncharacterized protein DUF4886